MRREVPEHRVYEPDVKHCALFQAKNAELVDFLSIGLGKTYSYCTTYNVISPPHERRHLYKNSYTRVVKVRNA